MITIQRIFIDGPQKVFDLLTGAEWRKWSRVVMNAEMRNLVCGLHPEDLDVLEISGTDWKDMNFRSYHDTQYPNYDLCESPLNGDASFDLIIADQVFEHLLWPYRAARNVLQMMRPGGYFLLSTPFLVRIHDEVDCTRWTETGLRYFLIECGFDPEHIVTGSWGNRACIKANLNLKKWARYRRNIHSLRNEPKFPYVVWALAKKKPDK